MHRDAARLEASARALSRGCAAVEKMAVTEQKKLWRRDLQIVAALIGPYRRVGWPSA